MTVAISGDWCTLRFTIQVLQECTDRSARWLAQTKTDMAPTSGDLAKIHVKRQRVSSICRCGYFVDSCMCRSGVFTFEVPQEDLRSPHARRRHIAVPDYDNKVHHGRAGLRRYLLVYSYTHLVWLDGFTPRYLLAVTVLLVSFVAGSYALTVLLVCDVCGYSSDGRRAWFTSEAGHWLVSTRSNSYTSYRL